MTESLSVLQVCADRGIVPGATKRAALHLRGLAAGLLELGHSVSTLSRSEPVGAFPSTVHPIEELPALASTGYDVVYERYSLGHTAGLDVAERTGALFVLEVNAPLVDEALTYRPETVQTHHHEVEAELLARADLAIVVSPQLADWARQFRSGPVAVVPNGFEPSWFNTPTQPEAAYDLAFLGHPKPWHGADSLPDLLAALEERGHHPSLIVIGGGKGAEAILDRARALGVEDQITVTGAVEPHVAAALVASASIGLAPYPRLDRFYFSPLKVIDYLAAGLAVVATRQGDVERLVGDAGVLVEPDDLDSYADAVGDLLADPALAKQMGSTGRRRAHAELTWRQAAQETVDAISRVTAEAKALA